MKILVSKTSDINMRFIYESIQFIDFPTGDEHKRYWISEYSKRIISLPCPEEQNKIAEFLSKIEEEIAMVRRLILQTEEFKKGLVSRLFA
jgi:type I restriction enzyme S subunit